MQYHSESYKYHIREIQNQIHPGKRRIQIHVFVEDEGVLSFGPKTVSSYVEIDETGRPTGVPLEPDTQYRTDMDDGYHFYYAYDAIGTDIILHTINIRKDCHSNPPYQPSASNYFGAVNYYKPTVEDYHDKWA
ncbi:hypothetical protein RRF57_006467 [Xylaria bambusicola]|uniref:Uncharacterized protein n=1 Tax=Xylaria bambusicola TaxID=326684 RepID=A0AAN7Z5L1_9PEZI